LIILNQFYKIGLIVDNAHLKTLIMQLENANSNRSETTNTQLREYVQNIQYAISKVPYESQLAIQPHLNNSYNPFDDPSNGAKYNSGDYKQMRDK